MGRRSVSELDRARTRQLAAALESQRGRRQLTVNDLAVASGVHYETVRAVLAGKSAGPSFFIVADLAGALGLSLNELARTAAR